MKKNEVWGVLASGQTLCDTSERLGLMMVAYVCSSEETHLNMLSTCWQEQGRPHHTHIRLCTDMGMHYQAPLSRHCMAS